MRSLFLFLLLMVAPFFLLPPLFDLLFVFLVGLPVTLWSVLRGVHFPRHTDMDVLSSDPGETERRYLDKRGMLRAAWTRYVG